LLPPIIGRVPCSDRGPAAVRDLEVGDGHMTVPTDHLLHASGDHHETIRDVVHPRRVGVAGYLDDGVAVAVELDAAHGVNSLRDHGVATGEDGNIDLLWRHLTLHACELLSDYAGNERAKVAVVADMLLYEHLNVGHSTPLIGFP
jgi:hypothetical protein